MSGKKSIILPLLAIAALLAALPLIARAQSDPPQIFVGTARVNGLPVASGMPVTVWQNDLKIAETATGSGGEFTLQVTGKEGILSFRIGELTADQKVPWRLGDITKGFILTAKDTADPCFTLPPEATALAEVDRPYYEITGKATVNGLPVPPGTPITAWWLGIGGQQSQIGYTLTRAEGSFTLQIIVNSDHINFRIGRMGALESLFSGFSGGGTFTIDLTAADSPCAGSGSGAAMDKLLAGKFVRAFTFDNAAKEWLFYDSAVGDASTLQSFIPGRAYFILVSESVGVSLNGSYQELSCIAANCWNLIVW